MIDLIKNTRTRLRQSIYGKSFREDWYKEEPWVKISSEERRSLKEKGFLASSGIIYDFKKYDEVLYVTDRDYRFLNPISRGTEALINNKAFIPCLFSWALSYLPEISISLFNGKVIYCIGSEFHQDYIRLFEALFKEHDELFVKKVDSSGGSDSFLVNQRNFPEVQPYLETGRWLVNNKLQNDTYSSGIFGSSINTLRVVFFRNHLGKMKIFRIFHRFGTTESGKVDNCSKGGIVCGVNIETGKLSKGLIYGSLHKNGRYARHLDTNAQLEGFTIPGWDDKIKDIQKIVQNLFYLSFGGLDIAVTEKGLKILEINSLPTMQITQMLEPALLDDEFSRFLRDAGYRN